MSQRPVSLYYSSVGAEKERRDRSGAERARKDEGRERTPGGRIKKIERQDAGLDKMRGAHTVGQRGGRIKEGDDS